MFDYFRGYKEGRWAVIGELKHYLYNLFINIELYLAILIYLFELVYVIDLTDRKDKQVFRTFFDNVKGKGNIVCKDNGNRDNDNRKSIPSIQIHI